jgi:hypothetical protein
MTTPPSNGSTRLAATEPASSLIYLNFDPVYDHLRRDPRFQKIVTCEHLDPAVDESQAK